MNVFLLRVWARCRRLLQGGRQTGAPMRETLQMERLMRRANPFASWIERAHWMVDVAAWLRQEPPVWSEKENSLVCAHRRTRMLLDWLQQQRETKRVVQTTLQKTLREAIGPELFCDTVRSPAQALMSRLLKPFSGLIFPATLAPHDMAGLLSALFPEPADERWLRGLDSETRVRLWKLMSDEAIAHGYQQQIDEALHYLVTMVLASGVGPEVRRRLGSRLPLRATPFMSLRRELEKYLATPGTDDGSMRSVRMLVAVCQAQTDKVYEHLDEHGVSVPLVMEVERMRSRLTRVARLIDLRTAVADQHAGQAVQLFLSEAVRDHQRFGVGSLLSRSFSLLTRKLVERNADSHERYVARDREQYSAIVRAACVGGAVIAVAVMGMLAIEGVGVAAFAEGLLYSSVFTVTLLTIAGLGGVLCGRQSPLAPAALAARMGSLDTLEGLRAVLNESAALIRAQCAALSGNLITVVPLIVIAAMAVKMLAGVVLMPAAEARQTIDALSLAGWTPLLAALTGLLLWLASLAAVVTDNWFALHRIRDSLAHHRGLVAVIGSVRTARIAQWCERHVATITGSVALGVLFGMMPAVGSFFGLPLDVRHAVISAAVLASAAMSTGQSVLTDPGFWLALAGLAATAVLNIAVPFLCSLSLAVHSRTLSGRLRRVLLRSLVRRFMAAPLSFLLPRRNSRPSSPYARDRSLRGVQQEKQYKPTDRTGTD